MLLRGKTHFVWTSMRTLDQATHARASVLLVCLHLYLFLVFSSSILSLSSAFRDSAAGSRVEFVSWSLWCAATDASTAVSRLLRLSPFTEEAALTYTHTNRGERKCDTGKGRYRLKTPTWVRRHPNLSSSPAIPHPAQTRPMVGGGGFRKWALSCAQVHPRTRRFSLSPCSGCLPLPPPLSPPPPRLRINSYAKKWSATDRAGASFFSPRLCPFGFFLLVVFHLLCDSENPPPHSQGPLNLLHSPFPFPFPFHSPPSCSFRAHIRGCVYGSLCLCVCACVCVYVCFYAARKTRRGILLSVVLRSRTPPCCFSIRSASCARWRLSVPSIDRVLCELLRSRRTHRWDGRRCRWHVCKIPVACFLLKASLRPTKGN